MKYTINMNEKKFFVDQLGKRHILFRITAAQDVVSPKGKCIIKKGEKGGWIEKTASLSQEGSCFILGEAMLLDEAKIEENAIVKDKAIVCNNSEVRQNAIVAGNSVVSEKSLIKGNAKILEYATLKDSPIISGDSVVKGYSVLSGQIYLVGKSKIKDWTQIFGKCFMDGNVVISGETYISGEHAFQGKHIYIKDSSINDKVTISDISTIWSSHWPITIDHTKIFGTTFITENSTIKHSRIGYSNLTNAYSIKNSRVINSVLTSVHITNSQILGTELNGMIIKNNKEKTSLGDVIRALYK